MRKRFARWGWVPCLLVAAGLPAAAPAPAATFTVNSEADTSDGVCDATSCTLREAIEEANASGGADTIDFDPGLGAGATIPLSSALPAIDDDLQILGSIPGGSVEIDGVLAHRVFFARDGNIVLSNLTIVNGLAKGGDGGDRAGGGLGAGGALFVDINADVTIVDVLFNDNAAEGGDGGSDGALDAAGGGGGLGGDGGEPSTSRAGGGGGGAFEGQDGQDGGLDPDGDPGIGDELLDGGDGGGQNAGMGGDGAPAGGPANDGGNAGSGGGGGGGGASLADGSGGNGGNAGAGGGGGGAGFPDADGGDGSFGGGGGGATGTGAGGQGGFGAGNGRNSGTGRGGSAYGGSIFVREGGTLKITNPDFSGRGACPNECVAAGTGGTDGDAAGGLLYLAKGVDLELEVGVATVLGDSISGEGGITKMGSEDLRLEPGNGLPNDYTGGTRILEGRIVAVNIDDLFGEVVVGISGDVDVSAGAELMLETVLLSGTFDVSVDGAGTLAKEGADRAILKGSNSIDNTEVRDGSLQGDTSNLQGTITLSDTTPDDPSLIFHMSNNGTFSSGDEVTSVGVPFTVEKRGSGNLKLDGRFTHEGVTVVDDGSLELVARADSNITGDVTLRSGTTLMGDGLADGLLVARNNSRVLPGTSSDPTETLSVGQVDFRNGSLLEVGIVATPGGGALGRNGKLDVTGDADINAGATVQVNLLAATLTSADPPEVYTVLSSGNLSGLFGSVSDQSFFYDTFLCERNPVTSDCEPIQQLPPSGNDVLVSVVRNDNSLDEAVDTANQKAVARALVEVVEAGNTTPDLDFIVSQIAVLPLEEIGAAFDALGGEGHSSFVTPQILNADKAARTTMARLGIVGGRAIGSPGNIDLARLMADPGRNPASEWLFAELGNAGALHVLAGAPAPVSLPPPEPEQRRWGAWMDGYGLFGDISGNRNNADIDWTVAGALAGLDMRLGQGGLLGVAGGYGWLDSSVNSRRFNGDANIYQAMLYGGYVWERFYIGALGRYAYDDFGSSRRILFGNVDRRAKADYNGHEAGGYVEAGVVAWAPAAVQLEPMASFHYTWLSHESFDETGAQSVDLEVDSENWNSMLGTLGLRVHRTFWIEPDDSLRFVPELWFRYAHQFGDRSRPVNARFSGATQGGDFRVKGAEVGREGAILGAGWSVTQGRWLSGYVYYDVSLANDLVGHAIAGGFLVRW